ncbi:DUF4893 domain-containing protein [Sphingomonas montanisoli]|uniref:DUF4893 domain-containing protein n=2 Tax=Sphingomonas montanisoli TaxID=2606412 RepID=A0A5D9C688_9SPHN|nr:DUF4893 domain-containing protein [Sphingomonas montanisoli]
MLIIPAALGCLAGCGGDGVEDRPQPASQPAASKPPKPQPSDWREIISDADRDRLARWRQSWMAGLEKAGAAGQAKAIAAQGMLMKPDLSMPGPSLPAGDYACRVIKMGAQAKGMPNYTAYPAFTCRVSAEGAVLRFAKLDGSQRHVGTIYPDDGTRMIFLGSLMLGDETRPLRYGRDTERDMVGVVERVGQARWRIAFPYPRWESLIDVMELTPKG